MSKAISIFKGLGYAYIFTLIVILIYNALLTFTKISPDNMGLIVSIITTFGAAFGGFYACKQIKEKGLKIKALFFSLQNQAARLKHI